jgi:hypothetical protein
MDSNIRLQISHWDSWTWLSQANHIFRRLGITSNFEDYGEASLTYRCQVFLLTYVHSFRGRNVVRR